MNSASDKHCVKSVRVRSFSGPYFPAFGQNTEKYGVSVRIESEDGKIRFRKTPNTDNFQAVEMVRLLSMWSFIQISMPIWNAASRL